MSAKQPKIIFEDLRSMHNVLKAVKTVNTLSPKIGDCLSEEEVMKLINLGYEITIIPIK